MIRHSAGVRAMDTCTRRRISSSSHRPSYWMRSTPISSAILGSRTMSSTSAVIYARTQPVRVQMLSRGVFFQARRLSNPQSSRPLALWHGRCAFYHSIATSVTHHHLQDEAYELGYQWAKLYEPGSPSRKLVTEVMDEALLVNIVHNDFHEPEKIFEPFFKLEEELRTQVSIVPNGNGHAVINGHSN